MQGILERWNLVRNRQMFGQLDFVIHLSACRGKRQEKAMAIPAQLQTHWESSGDPSPCPPELDVNCFQAQPTPLHHHPNSCDPISCRNLCVALV